MPPTASRLDEIVEHTRAVVEERRATADLAAMERAAADHHPRGFLRALRERAATGPTIIAELKKASPSKGLIREEFSPAQLACDLAAAGAACLSVLTEERWFLGSLDNLRAASAAVTIPCLRKDFIVDEFQLIEARANHADAVLLIAAALHDEELSQLAHQAQARHLDVLCEVHDAAEMARVLALDLDTATTAIGVNARNLHTFAVSHDEMAGLAAMTKNRFLLVAESGIQSAGDIARLRAQGFAAFLIGEFLMRAPEPGKHLQSLLQICG